MGRADHISKLYTALGVDSLSEPGGIAESSEVTPVTLQRLLGELNQGTAGFLRPPEMVEGPQGEVYSDQLAPKVVVVVSATGGVGRSTLAAALASGLQRQGAPDACFGAGSAKCTAPPFVPRA